MALSMRGIQKAFGANLVLRDVGLTLEGGEIRALIGENGAGKTTLMNILGGVVSADLGTIQVDGALMRFHSPRESLAAGIAFIHQELNLVNDLTVCENLFLGREIKKRSGLLDAMEMHNQAKAVLDSIGIDLDPGAMVRDLDASYKQVVEIVRALQARARIIIMDEPTTSLTETEIARVFGMMRQVKSQGVSIIFISHKLGEVLTVCDTFTVLRDGRVVAEGETSGVKEIDLARHMVGHDVRTESLHKERDQGEVAMRATGLTLGRAFRGVDFALRAGEILGFTGLLGDGRSALFQAIFSGAKGITGSLTVNGQTVRPRGTSHSLRIGIGYVPRDRKENGIVKDMTVLHNMSLVTIGRLTRAGLIDHRRERAMAEGQVRDLRIKVESVDLPIGSLSGGNQQKVVLAKWLAASPRIMIFDNPTQGVDVGAKEEIYDIIGRLADEGVAVVILSSEAQEIVRVCGRALVMYAGEICGELTGRDLSEQNIMVLATGGSLSGPQTEAGGVEE